MDDRNAARGDAAAETSRAGAGSRGPGRPDGPGAHLAPGTAWYPAGLRGLLHGPRVTAVRTAVGRMAGDVKDYGLTDRAAALTYYGILSLFPALLVLVSLLSLAGHGTTTTVVNTIKRFVPGSARDVVIGSVEQIQKAAGVGSVLAAVGLVVALWTASGYVGAFIRAANAAYGMPEGRPAWRVVLVRVGVTAALMVLAVSSALIVVFTGGLAHRAGAALGVGQTALTAWSILKWPVLVVLVTAMIALLYRTTPNVRMHNGPRWITPGSCVALLLWMAASAGFAVYVANFGSYNRTYGTLAGVIVFLVWLWISNLAILLGLTFDAGRVGPGAGTGRPGQHPEPRDVRAWDENDRRRAAAENGPD